MAAISNCKMWKSLNDKTHIVSWKSFRLCSAKVTFVGIAGSCPVGQIIYSFIEYCSVMKKTRTSQNTPQIKALKHQCLEKQPILCDKNP